jgi:hypothetical protein
MRLSPPVGENSPQISQENSIRKWPINHNNSPFSETRFKTILSAFWSKRRRHRSRFSGQGIICFRIEPVSRNNCRINHDLHTGTRIADLTLLIEDHPLPWFGQSITIIRHFLKRDSTKDLIQGISKVVFRDANLFHELHLNPVHNDLNLNFRHFVGVAWHRFISPL